MLCVCISVMYVGIIDRLAYWCQYMSIVMPICLVFTDLIVHIIATPIPTPPLTHHCMKLTVVTGHQGNPKIHISGEYITLNSFD